MKNTYIQANLVSPTRINLLLFTGVVLPNNPVFFIEKDDEQPIKLKVNRHISNNNISIFELDLNKEFEYGHRYVVILEGFPRVNVDVSEATNFPGFDEKFYYEGDDLGAIYSPKETRFNVWAPLASSVFLKIEINKEFHHLMMERDDKGVFRAIVEGDLLNARYHYLVTNSGITSETNDPWGKGASYNSEYSAVVDIEAVKQIKQYKPSYKMKDNADAVIYETSIRDFTEEKHTNIVNKGKYLGMVEPSRQTTGGHPAGLDYLKYLGITHLQILPVIDFYGNDDKDIYKSYNWGYNPISFFAIEGSYSTKPENPMNRLIEFKTMVEELHKNNIRVVMDVVYNHLYEFMYTSFEKTVPNYFYRKRPNGLPACASGCGNDFASEKKMARKAILASLEYFTDVFDIDGYRFDLMGLIDIETINEGYRLVKNIKDDAIIYGEGWNMGVELPFDKKACSDNADKMPGIAFFNDLFRDTIKGGNFEDNISQKGYVGSNLERQDIVNYVMRGSVIDIPFKHRFLDFNQSINYVECHDNNTLFDKLTFSNSDEDVSTLLKRVELANKLVLLAFGVPLLHMGQEIGQSKSGLNNTYNVLKVNNMNWKLVDSRFEMVEALASFISMRKNMFNYLHLTFSKEVNNIFETQYWGNGMLVFTSEKSEYLKPFNKLSILINPTKEKKTYELDDYYHLLVNGGKQGQDIIMKNGIIPPLKLQILYK